MAKRVCDSFKHCVYELYAKDGTCLYVGFTWRLSERLKEHAVRQLWAPVISEVRVTEYPDRATAVQAEQERIDLLNPIHNEVFTIRKNLRRLRQPATLGVMTHLTSREVVEQRGVSHRTLLRMIEKKEITPAEKLQGKTGSYLFDPEEVERAFAERPEQSKGGRPRKARAA